MYLMTSSANYSVMFDMWTVDGTYYYAQYSRFTVLSESEGYRLQVSGNRHYTIQIIKALVVALHQSDIPISTSRSCPLTAEYQLF